MIAQINYVEDTGITPEFWNLASDRNTFEIESVAVDVEDGSLEGNAPTLEREGFALLRHSSSVGDLASPDAALDVYREELRVFVQQVTRADDVRMEQFSPVRRVRPNPDLDFDNCLPAGFAHSDCTKEGIEPMVAWAYGTNRPARPVKRMALFNLWRLLSPAPADVPLAVLDSRTLSKDDIIAGYSHFEDFALQSAFIKHNPAHRWVYYSQMTLDDILVFKQYDSEPDQPGVVAHSAFLAPCPNAVHRVSIEARAMASWFER